MEEENISKSKQIVNLSGLLSKTLSNITSVDIIRESENLDIIGFKGDTRSQRLMVDNSLKDALCDYLISQYKREELVIQNDILSLLKD